MKNLVLALLMIFFILIPLAAQQAEPAQIENDEGGPVMIVGEANYTFPAFRAFFYEPYIVLRDSAYLVDRDYDFIDAEPSQIIGKITSDAFTPPFSYQVSLPIVPLAERRDVDNDRRRDEGVMIFNVQVAQNMLGDPYQEQRDFISGLLSSVKTSEDPGEELEVIGGRLLIWAPDEFQGFPSGFGEDGALFTPDDPVVIVPQGYTVVDMNQEPFIFSREREAAMELFEPEQVEANDLTDLSFTEAFDEMIELFRKEYAFTEYKNIDWDALQAEFRPRVEAAESVNDVDGFRRVIRDFAWSIPDGHVSAPITNAEFQEAIEGGIGLSIRELDDERVIVHFVTPESPADAAGIELRAEIIAVDGVPILDAIDETIAWSGPFSTPDFRRLQQLRYVVRFPIDKGEVEITFQNPDADAPETVVLPLVEEIESFNFSSFTQGLEGTELPIQFEILESGYGYIKIFSFSDDLPLTFRLWERALDTMNAADVPGIILDMRQNGGGSAYMGDQLPAYFFDEELNLGYSAFYEEAIDDFYYNPELPSEFVLPPEEKRYDGPVAVLIHPFCQSACESFSYNMALNDRAAIVGQYTTSGLGGSVVPIFLPGGVRTSITNGRSLNAEGEIQLEGVGVVPTVRVPVTEETLFSEGDPVLETAIAYLEGLANVPVTDVGEITVGEPITASIQVGERLRYRLQLPQDQTLDFLAGSEDGLLDTYIRIYVEGSDTVVLENDDDEDFGAINVFSSALRNIPVPGELPIIVEVGTFDDAEAGEFTLLVQQAEQRTIFELALLDSNFSIFVQAVQAADLVDVFAGEGPITAFLPNNDAFQAVLRDLNMTPEELLADTDLLRDILLYHAIGTNLTTDNLILLNDIEISTLLPDSVILVEAEDEENIILNGSVNVVLADIGASNGTIHLIDAVLLPEGN